VRVLQPHCCNVPLSISVFFFVSKSITFLFLHLLCILRHPLYCYHVNQCTYTIVFTYQSRLCNWILFLPFSTYESNNLICIFLNNTLTSSFSPFSFYPQDSSIMSLALLQNALFLSVKLVDFNFCVMFSAMFIEVLSNIEQKKLFSFKV
jgi:hypothetical protein